MTLVEEIERFVTAHRTCGSLVGDATPPGPRGYLLWIRCPCGVLFEQWVTPEAAERDLVSSALLATPN